jgi:solute carrier family 25 (mitochondrial folate transporter), member 32
MMTPSFIVDPKSSSRLGSSIRIVREILRSKQSPINALYRGLSPNLIGNSISWALYFVWYDKTKREIQAYHGDQSELPFHAFFLASGVAGMSS